MTYAKPPGGDASPRPSGLRRLASVQLSPAPDLGGRWRLVLTALAVALVVGLILGLRQSHDLRAALGDTDDATRLVMVRQLVDGGGWWNEQLTRFQPPMGLYMHWSRLLDGGIAAMDLLFRLGLSGPDAELATRFLWPLLWIFPAVLATLWTARRLADTSADGGGANLTGGAVVLIAAVILASDLPLYIQFRPGRIDHHDVQMTLTFLALAGAVQRSPNRRGAILAGVATGLGLAIGLEGLVFEAVIGAAIALRFAVDPRQAREARGYGLALALTTLVAFGVQTPPWRWAVPACDALAVNLVAGLAAAGFGLALAARLTAGRGWAWRFGALAAVGTVAGAAYLGVYPNCRHGFFADVDPRIRPIWLNYVQEIRPIWAVWKHDLAQGAGFVAVWAWGGLAWLVLGLRRARWSDPAWLLSGACLALGIGAGAELIRASGYAEWISIPLVAAAVVDLLRRLGYRNWLAAVLAAAVANPVVASGLASAAAEKIAPLLPHKGHAKPAAKPVKAAAKKPDGPDPCFSLAGYRALDAARPHGLVLGEIDFGPFILAYTGDSSLGGPYHRMGWGILKAHALLKASADDAGPNGAYALSRAAGVRYVLECHAHARHGDRSDMGKAALQKRLDAGRPPPWLQPLTPPNAALLTYRLAPAFVAAAPPKAAPRP